MGEGELRADVITMQAPPPYCRYAGGPCDESFEKSPVSDALFLYPSDPAIIAGTIERGIQELRRIAPASRWLSWKDLGVSGQIIFCQICKALRFTQRVIADVTTLNFNLLFEIGHAIGLGLPVLPVRDTSYVKDEKVFDELGLLDTIGYIDFQNSETLVAGISNRMDAAPLIFQKLSANKEQPLYLVRSYVHNEGMVKLMSSLKKSGLRFRAFDPKETPRLSLHEAAKQVTSSFGVIVHLVAPERVGALSHNSRCAFVAGLAMALGKNVLMLQETDVPQPIDYRDVVQSYSHPGQVPDILIPLIREVVETLQESRFVPTALPLKPLEKLDLGDLAAENEIKALRSYFVPTGEYNEAKRGHARLVVGRKGAGKTAIFYGIRSAYKPSLSHLVLDLKPEGHQFIKLREAVLSELSPGLQQHVLTAFWNYLLLQEIAHKIVHEEEKISYRNARLRPAYLKVREAYGTPNQLEQGDFSERLLQLVDDIVARRMDIPSIVGTPEVSDLIYKKDIRPLNDALAEYLALKESVWLLVDNLDKGWPVFAIKREDILILRSLLEGTRKLQRQLESREVEFHAVIFIRNDIYQHLVVEGPDRGKDTAVLLDWSDPEVFKEIIRRRIILSAEVEGSFEELWPLFFATHVAGEDSFSYVVRHTLMRPREVLSFLRDCLDVAVNRGHDKVAEEDILQAETAYSDDALQDISLELRDVNPDYPDILYAFIGAPTILSRNQVDALLRAGGVPPDQIEKMLDFLLWFGFLGVYVHLDEEHYSYQFQHNLAKMQNELKRSEGFCVHPAFRRALGCMEI